MLVAKHAKVFSRTGTQPFLFTCHVGDRLKECKFTSLRAICSPLAPRRSSSRGMLAIRNNLGVGAESSLYVSAFWRLAKSRTLCAGPRQAFAMPVRQGQRSSQKNIPAENANSLPLRVSCQRLPRAAKRVVHSWNLGTGILPATRMAKATLPQRLREFL